MNAPTSLIPLVEANPAMVLVDAEKFDRFYEEVAREVRSHVPDLTTGKGRDAIASLAMKVSKTKTAIDEARKVLTEEARTQIKKVDEQGKVIRDKLDALRDEVKQPLVEWRAAEDARVEACKVITDGLRRDAVVSLDDTSETVAGRLDLVRAVEITEAKFTDQFPIVTILQRNAIEALEAAHARLVREEADRAELARLRAAEEERQRREEEARAAEAARVAAAEAEEARKAAAERAAADEKARIEAAAKAAQEAATAQAERAAEEARAAQQRQHDEALAAEKRRADEAEAARKAEADRVARDEAVRAAEAKREADAQAARDANRAHRGKVMLAAKTAIMGHGVGEANAKAIVLAIVANEIPHTSIRF